MTWLFTFTGFGIGFLVGFAVAVIGFWIISDD